MVSLKHLLPENKKVLKYEGVFWKDKEAAEKCSYQPNMGQFWHQTSKIPWIHTLKDRKKKLLLIKVKMDSVRNQAGESLMEEIRGLHSLKISPHKLLNNHKRKNTSSRVEKPGNTLTKWLYGSKRIVCASGHDSERKWYLPCGILVKYAWTESNQTNKQR